MPTRPPRTLSPLAIRFALVACLHATSASAQSTTVQINGETKQIEGVLRSAEAGDVACLLTLESASGETFYESAAFELCEDAALINQTLRLSYTVENVLAAECQGDVDCGKSEQVVLVSAARVLTASEDVDPSSNSHCTAAETTVFACRIGRKSVAVCASADAAADAGTLHYRYGVADASAPLELVLPKVRSLPAQSALGEAQPFAGGGGSWLRFRSGDYSYVVYSGIGRWGQNGETLEKQGVVVERGGTAIATLPCTGPQHGVLGPEWFEQLGIGAAGETFDFPES